MSVVAIEAGARLSKVAVIDGGRVLGLASRGNRIHNRHDGWAEQDAEAVWSGIDEAALEALAQSRAAASVEAVTVSVQGDAIIPIDSKYRGLDFAILGMDKRNHAEANDLTTRFGGGPLYTATGMPPGPLNAITKILWFERNRRALAGEVWKYVHYGDFLGLKLAGVPALDYSMASRSMAFDPVRKDWLPSVLDYVGITPAHLGNVCPSGSPVGIVHRSVAERWGISPSALLVSGAHNQCMAAIGAGVLEPGAACYSMSHSEVISAQLFGAAASPGMLAAQLPCYCHALPDRFITIALNQGGGEIALEWLCNSILESPGDLEIAALPSPVLFLPHLTGNATSTRDSQSKGAFIGLTLNTGRQDLLRAVIDAQAFEARLNIEAFESVDINVSEIRAVDQGSRITKALEIKATVLERPIETLENPDASLLGAALVAQTAMKQFSDIQSAVSECVRVASVIEPRLDVRDAYMDALERYRPLGSMFTNYYRHWALEKEPAFA